MKEVSSRFKNLDTAGIVMASCPHGCVLDAVDMCEGETFRHTLIPHLKLSKINCKFLVNDVICKYWPLAQFLAKELKSQFFLTLAIFYWNLRKERVLARLICTRLLNVSKILITLIVICK